MPLLQRRKKRKLNAGLLRYLESRKRIEDAAETTSGISAADFHQQASISTPSCSTLLPPFERVLIKEEIEVDSNLTEKYLLPSGYNKVKFELNCSTLTEESDPLEVKHHVNLPSSVASEQTHVPSYYPTTAIKGLSEHFRAANILSLDVDNVLNCHISNLVNLNPAEPRLPTSNSQLSALESKSEQKLRTLYLQIMIKKEEELINLKIEINRVQLQKHKMEMDNIKEIHLQNMENLKLKHALLKLQLENARCK